jgi:DNA-binding transcriptional regulator YdaS (Cro superfamily)
LIRDRCVKEKRLLGKGGLFGLVKLVGISPSIVNQFIVIFCLKRPVSQRVEWKG